MQSDRKLKVLLTNAYAMDKIYELYKKGLCPGHHLYGALELRKDHNMEVVILPHEKYPFLNKIGNWFDIGLIEQQLRAIYALRKCDILYAPYAAANTKLIVLGKLLGLIKKPVIILVHQPLFGVPSSKKWKRKLVKKLIMQYDTLIFLSEQMRTELIRDYEIDPEHARKHFFTSHWGVDINFFQKYNGQNHFEEKRFVVSSGNTARDFDIIVKAFERIKFPLKIYCKPESFPKTKVIPENVEIISGNVPFEMICQDYADARMILIPLAPNPEGTIGLTSLLEAMAVGKPVIMTRNEKVDVDIENEKVGMIVEENDVEGWVTSINSMLNNFPLLKEMGDNIYKLGYTKFDMDVFGQQLAYVISDTFKRYQKR